MVKDYTDTQIEELGEALIKEFSKLTCDDYTIGSLLAESLVEAVLNKMKEMET